MRLVALCLSIGLAGLVAPSVAQAADWNNGAEGIKDYRAAGAAIPAPIPYAETFKWYLRADLAFGYTSEPDVKETGTAYGIQRDLFDGNGLPFGSQSSWFKSDFDTFVSGGVGVGAYFGNQIRGDLTVDVETRNAIKSDATYSYMYDGGGANPSTVRADGTVNDRIDVRNTVMLANLYWDFARPNSVFTPYLGLGVGAAMRSMGRHYSARESLVDTTDGSYAGTGTRYSGKAKAYQLAPAAAFTAGLGYALSPGVILDVNYRFTYIGSADFGTQVAFSPADSNGVTRTVSRVTVGDTYEHALRAGLRWNVW
ncbi:MAG: outer membrane protein [Hyphomicrobiaceae bacterium]